MKIIHPSYEFLRKRKFELLRSYHLGQVEATRPLALIHSERHLYLNVFYIVSWRLTKVWWLNLATISCSKEYIFRIIKDEYEIATQWKFRRFLRGLCSFNFYYHKHNMFLEATKHEVVDKWRQYAQHLQDVFFINEKYYNYDYDYYIPLRTL